MDALATIRSAAPAAAVPRPVLVRELGRAPYEPVWRAMQRFTDARGQSTLDEVWLVEHTPVFTLGQAGTLEHVLAAGSIPVVRTDRGGQVTYHGPGQIVLYPLLDLSRLKISVRDYVCRIEQAMIDTLADWNIDAVRRQGAPGVYVGDAKIGALGVRVRRGRTFHGLAFNVAMDMEPWRRIHPCGYRGLRVITLADLGGSDSLERVKPVLLHHLVRLLGLEPQPI